MTDAKVNPETLAERFNVCADCPDPQACLNWWVDPRCRKASEAVVASVETMRVELHAAWAGSPEGSLKEYLAKWRDNLQAVLAALRQRPQESWNLLRAELTRYVTEGRGSETTTYRWVLNLMSGFERQRPQDFTLGQEWVARVTNAPDEPQVDLIGQRPQEERPMSKESDHQLAGVASPDPLQWGQAAGNCDPDAFR